MRKISSKLFSLLVTVFSMLLFSRSIAQTNFYVNASTGSDATGDGSAAHPWKTIQYAVTNSSGSGIVLNVSSGTYAENVVLGKTLTLQGVDTTTIISPASGVGISIAANNVSISNLKVANTLSAGIASSGSITSLSLANVKCDADSVGAQLSNVNGLSMNGCVFSNNQGDGFYASPGKNFTFNNCTASANGNPAGSGFLFRNVTGTSTLTNITANHNKTHGLDIRNGSTNITVNGGDFEYNGTTNPSDGGGISLFAKSATDSNIALNGPITSSNNITCGVYVDAHNSSNDSIKGLTIGQSGGAVSFSSNGTSKGTGILLWGNVSDVTVTANFSKGTVSNSAGLIIVGQNSSGSSSPRNITIVNSVFQVGYTKSTPAISLADAQSSPSYIDINDVTATSNTFLGASGYSAIDDSLIYDKLDNSALGRVNQTDNKLPVELVSFRADVTDHTVQLQWSTATEVNNYGFEVEKRSTSPSPLLSKEERMEASRFACSRYTQTLSRRGGSWTKIGFVMGNGTSNIVQKYFYTDDVTQSGRYAYCLKQIDNDGVFKYSQEVEVEIALPKVSVLHQNYPNPFNPQTIISYQLSVATHVNLKVYDVLGREVATLVDGMKEAGYYTLVFSTSGGNGSPFASGMYFARFIAQPADGRKCFEQVRKMLFLK